MEDYYQILGIPESASEPAIKSAYRKLAFRYHPDTNPGNEKAVEAHFKKINEAYCVLGDKLKRQQYDAARRGQFAGSPYQSFTYTQQDIFRGMFSGQGMFSELERMFSQAGLRFDRDFVSRVFFNGQGFTFYASSAPDGVTTYKPGLTERVLGKLGKFLIRVLFGIKYEEPPAKESLDQHLALELSPAEALSGGEKPITYKRDNRKMRLMVRIPAGVKAGTRIRLRNMGQIKGGIAGDLYLHIRVK